MAATAGGLRTERALAALFCTALVFLVIGLTSESLRKLGSEVAHLEERLSSLESRVAGLSRDSRGSRDDDPRAVTLSQVKKDVASWSTQFGTLLTDLNTEIRARKRLEALYENLSKAVQQKTDDGGYGVSIRPLTRAPISVPAWRPARPNLPQFMFVNDLTQESMMQQLVHIWGRERDRVFVDLGSHAGFGSYLQYNDALIFMEYFHHGGKVLAVDAFEDFSLDVDHRFHHVEPYASWPLTKKSLTCVIANQDGQPAHIAHIAKMHTFYCSDHSFDGIKYDRLDALDVDHLCRITRQRLGRCNSTLCQRLPLPPATPGYNVSVPTRSIDSIWGKELNSSHIDFLKVDIDTHWRYFWTKGAKHLLGARAFSIMLMEFDRSWGPNVSQAVDQFVTYMEQHDYATYLKVPCGNTFSGGKRLCGRGECVYDNVKNRAVAQEYLYKISHEQHQWIPPGMKLQQDLLVIDMRQPELFALEHLGKQACQSFLPPHNPMLKRSSQRQA